MARPTLVNSSLNTLLICFWAKIILQIPLSSLTFIAYEKICQNLNLQCVYFILQIAAAAAAKFKKINPNLGSREKSDKHVRSLFTNSMNRGHATYATKAWLEEVKMMYGYFNEHHPEV